MKPIDNPTQNQITCRSQNTRLFFERLDVAASHLAQQLEDTTSPQPQLLESLRSLGLRDLLKETQDPTLLEKALNEREAAIKASFSHPQSSDMYEVSSVFAAARLALNYAPDYPLQRSQCNLLSYLLMGCSRSHDTVLTLAAADLMRFDETQMRMATNQLSSAIESPKDLLRPEFYNQNIIQQSKSQLMQKAKSCRDIALAAYAEQSLMWLGDGSGGPSVTFRMPDEVPHSITPHAMLVVGGILGVAVGLAALAPGIKHMYDLHADKERDEAPKSRAEKLKKGTDHVSRQQPQPQPGQPILR